MKLLKKLLIPSYTDNKVDSINAESQTMLTESTKLAKRHNELLKKNGVALHIFIATGGDQRGH